MITEPSVFGAPVMRTVFAPVPSLAPNPEPAAVPSPGDTAAITGSGASEDFSRSVQLALLSLLKGAAADACIAGLRRLGAMGPAESDYLALERDGLAVRGAVSGHRILTPRGRTIAANVAIDVAHRTRAHRAVYGVDRKANEAYFRCSCGVFQSETFSAAAQRRMRQAWSFHREALGQLVKTAPMAQGSPEDARALISAQVQAFIAATQGGADG